MINSENAILEKLAIHKTGNKSRDEGIVLSESPVRLNQAVSDLLIRYFISPFREKEYYNLYHETDLRLNEVYHYVSEIFDNSAGFMEHSKNLAKTLYECSSHPKIKSGEFYTALFCRLLIDGEEVDAIGLFRSESRETYLRVFPEDNNFTVEHEDGININKLDKGCLIFNLERETGYVAATVDALSKGNDAMYWMDTFLKVRQRNDDFFQTSQALSMCRQFVKERLPEVFETDLPAQAEMLNKSIKFFKENDNFTIQEFSGEVFDQPELIQTFNDYRRDFEAERDIKINDGFSISGQAVRKQSKIFKSVIKLDRNFHIYVHGNRDFIEKGFDEERNMQYYRLYYKEEQ